MYITGSSAISHQPSFKSRGYSNNILPLKANSELIHPDYSQFIPAMDRRRMTDILKMSIACSIDLIEQVNNHQPDAIIIGTSMGCCRQTKKFIDNVYEAKGGLISPTPFITSTHNTIAGQISIHLRNTNYNTTYSHNSLSMEHALLDAKMLLQEEKNCVLIGSADESEKDLHNISVRLKLSVSELFSGASFFMIEKEQPMTECVKFIDVALSVFVSDFVDFTNNFLQVNKLKNDEIDLVVYSSCVNSMKQHLENLFPTARLIDYSLYSGIYYSNSGFGMHYAVDQLLISRNYKNALVFNNLIEENLGVILLSS